MQIMTVDYKEEGTNGTGKFHQWPPTYVSSYWLLALL